MPPKYSRVNRPPNIAKKRVTSAPTPNRISDDEVELPSSYYNAQQALHRGEYTPYQPRRNNIEHKTEAAAAAAAAQEWSNALCKLEPEDALKATFLQNAMSAEERAAALSLSESTILEAIPVEDRGPDILLAEVDSLLEESQQGNPSPAAVTPGMMVWLKQNVWDGDGLTVPKDHPHRDTTPKHASMAVGGREPGAGGGMVLDSSVQRDLMRWLSETFGHVSGLDSFAAALILILPEQVSLLINIRPYMVITDRCAAAPGRSREARKGGRGVSLHRSTGR